MQMVTNTLENGIGRRIPKKEEAYKCGKMALGMRANGKIIKLMDKEHFGMFMEINTRGNGKEIKPMDLENTPIVMEQLMKVTGAMIYSMVTE